MSRKFFSIILLATLSMFALPLFADNDTIVVDFSVGVDTAWKKTALKTNKNLVYANCGLVNSVLRNGVSAFWYSDKQLETHFQFGEKLVQTDTVPAFGAFDYDGKKIKKKLGNQYQWFVDSYGDKDLIVRLRMFVRNDEGRLLFFRSGVLPTSLTREKPLKVYWDKVHTTMGVEQTYRIEPNDIPDVLQIVVTNGTSIKVTVERLSNGEYVPLATNETATQSAAFYLDLKEAKTKNEPIYVTVARATAANVSKLKLVKQDVIAPPIKEDTVFRTVDTLACYGTPVIINGLTYIRNTSVTVYGTPYTDQAGIHTPATTYNLSFVTVPRSTDTVIVSSFPYVCEDGSIVSGQGWLNRHIETDNVCGDSIHATYYQQEEQKTNVIIPQTVRIDTTLCEGSVFELEGAAYTTPQRVSNTVRRISNDTTYVTVTIYTLKFEELEIHRDTFYVKSFPATVNGVTANAAGWVSQSVPADNICGEIRYEHFFTNPRYDTVQHVIVDTLSCEGSVVHLNNSDFTSDTTFTLYASVDNGSVVEVAATTYSIEFEEQQIYYDTVFVAKLPATVEGKLVTEEGWMQVEKPVNTVCGKAIYNYYVVIDQSIRWGSSCEHSLLFEYGFDQWINDTLWMVCLVPELRQNGFSAYWNPIEEADSLEISIFLNCESAPLETRCISFDRYYHLSPYQINNNYLDKLAERGLNIDDITELAVRFVPRGQGELIALKYGQQSDHYIIEETLVTDTMCDGQQYVVDGRPYFETFHLVKSERTTNEIGTVTTVLTTVYDISFIQTYIARDTIYVESFPYVTPEGVTVQVAGPVFTWVEDDSACGWHQQHTYYRLGNGLFDDKMPVTINPNYAEAGQDINIISDGSNRLSVYDVLGRQIMSLDFENSTVIRLAQQGEYIVRIQNSNASGVKKIIIK